RTLSAALSACRVHTLVNAPRLFAEHPPARLRIVKGMDPVIQLDGLEVRFGSRTILNKLTASLTGQAIGLLGPNGAGKSTLINTLLGFHKPSSGTARIFGHDIRTNARAVRALTGYMPETDAYMAKMTGFHFVRRMADLSR